MLNYINKDSSNALVLPLTDNVPFFKLDLILDNFSTQADKM